MDQDYASLSGVAGSGDAFRKNKRWKHRREAAEPGSGGRRGRPRAPVYAEDEDEDESEDEEILYGHLLEDEQEDYSSDLFDSGFTSDGYKEEEEEDELLVVDDDEEHINAARKHGRKHSASSSSSSAAYYDSDAESNAGSGAEGGVFAVERVVDRRVTEVRSLELYFIFFFVSFLRYRSH